MDYRNNNLRQEYLKQSVMTASPTELIVMLLDSCIKNLKLAEMCYIEEKDISNSSSCLIKAQKIIMELVNSLDTSMEISSQLLPIYEYLLHEIRLMNSKKDFELLPNVLEIVTSMRDTWEQVSKSRMLASEVS